MNSDPDFVPASAVELQAPANFYSARGYETNESVGWLMRRLVAHLTQDIDRQLDEHDLTNAQWMPLYKIAKSGGSTVAELARLCESDNGAMTRVLDRLEAKGLLRRVRSSTDRRVVNLELTPEGKRAADKVPKVLADVLNSHLAGFSREEFSTLLRSLQRMLANAEALKARNCAAADNQE
jgi:DNA-binding MarR family transcriptional regulator